MRKLLLAATLCFITTCCTPNESDNKPKQINNILLKEIFDYDSDILVYFYSDYCRHCLAIKENMLVFALNTAESLYFCNIDNEDIHFSSGKNGVLGVNSLDDFYIVGTPSLLEIDHREVVNYYLGEQEILQYIERAK